MSFTLLAPNWVAHRDGFSVLLTEEPRAVYSDPTTRATFDLRVDGTAVEVTSVGATVAADPGSDVTSDTTIVVRTTAALLALGLAADCPREQLDAALSYRLLADVEGLTPHALLALSRLADSPGEWTGRVLRATSDGDVVTLSLVGGRGSTLSWPLTSAVVVEQLPAVASASLSGIPGYVGATAEPLADEVGFPDDLPRLEVLAPNGDRMTFLIGGQLSTGIVTDGERAVIALVDSALLVPFALEALAVSLSVDGRWSHELTYLAPGGEPESAAAVGSVADLLRWFARVNDQREAA